MAIFRAIDESGKEIWAGDMEVERGKYYKCPDCGVEIYKRVSPKGVPHFVRRRGEKHTAPKCIDLVDQNNYYDRKKISVEDFHLHMLRESDGGGTPGGDGGHRPPEDPDLKLKQVHNLSDLYYTDLYKDYDEKLMKGKYLHDMMINSKSADIVFSENGPVNLGPRAIVVQPDGIDWEYMWIRYVLRFQRPANNNEMQAIYFFQQFSDEKLFTRTGKKFFEPGSGRVLESKYECVIIYGEWQFNRCPRCEIMDPEARTRCNAQWKCLKYGFVADCWKSKYIGCFR